MLEFASHNKYVLFLSGDLNIDMLPVSNISSDFLSILTSSGFNNVINEPTCMTDKTESILDLFITNADSAVESSRTLVCDISDHLPILAFISDGNEAKHDRSTSICTQDVTDCSLQRFQTEVQDHDWSHILLCTDAYSIYQAFMVDFKAIYKKHFPYIVPRKYKKSYKPGINSSIHRQINLKNRTYWEFVKTKDIKKFKALKVFRSKLNAKLKAVKEVYYQANLAMWWIIILCSGSNWTAL